MKIIIEKLKKLREDFMVSTQAMAPFPTPVVDATGTEYKGHPKKDKEEISKEKELK